MDLSKTIFGTYQNSTAKLQAKLNQIIAGNIPRFRGLFWFQGESDGAGTPPYQNNIQRMIIITDGVVS